MNIFLVLCALTMSGDLAPVEVVNDYPYTSYEECFGDANRQHTIDIATVRADAHGGVMAMVCTELSEDDWKDMMYTD